jgi:threonine/homoserine/homoserine lactone efflux protein
MFATILPFVLTSLAIELTPGPNMAYLAVLSMAHGRRAGLAAVAGIALGLLLLGALAGLGLGTLVLETPWLYQLLRWGGLAFLLFLAWDAFRESRAPLQAAEGPSPLARYFRRGLVTNLLNPKAAVFYIAVMPNFVDRSVADWPQTLTLTAIYVAIATLIHAGIPLSGSLLQPVLSSPRVRQPAGVVAALLLVGIAAWLFLTTRSAG